VPFFGGFFGLGLGGCVSAEQVVELEAVRSDLFQQVGADQIVQELAGTAEGQIAERGGRVEAELGGRVEAEQPEEPGRGRG
jgi:hypothetical protein